MLGGFWGASWAVLESEVRVGRRFTTIFGVFFSHKEAVLGCLGKALGGNLSIVGPPGLSLAPLGMAWSATFKVKWSHIETLHLECF